MIGVTASLLRSYGIWHVSFAAHAIIAEEVSDPATISHLLPIQHDPFSLPITLGILISFDIELFQ